jgi:hypothetical protein
MRTHLARKCSTFVYLLSLTACGVFGADDPAGADPSAPPPTNPISAGENAKPPVPGAPLDGVFVSSSRGDDAAAEGSMAKPFKTLAAAMAHAEKVGKRVLACAETYPEVLRVRSGVSVYGYFACDGGAFRQDDARRARVEAPESPALVAEGVALPTRLEGLEVIAPDAAPEHPSSIGAFARGSKELTLARSRVVAQDGLPGVDGASPSDSSPAGGNGLVGHGSSCDAAYACFLRGSAGNPGGAGAPGVACGGGVTSGPGGNGGEGATQNGAKFAPSTGGGGGTPETAPGGAVDIHFGNPGVRGGNGARGADGTNGAIRFTKDGLIVSDGAPGGSGAPGQGGGGGGGVSRIGDSDLVLAPSGGGGGAGGCPGRAGTPGTTGGSSIGIYSVDSVITLEGVDVETGRGGRAGVGSFGSAPTAGGRGADGLFNRILVNTNSQDVRGGDGGGGGAGGAAGVSGHGAPGASIGVISIGMAIKIRDGSVRTGAGGEGAPELSDGAGGVLPATGGGESKDRLDVP